MTICIYSTVDVPAKINLSPAKTIVMQKGDNGLFKCPFEGSPPPVLKYYHNNVSINTSSPRYKIYPDGTLIIVNVTTSDEGSYYCKIASNYNESINGTNRSNPIKVTVYSKYL